MASTKKICFTIEAKAKSLLEGAQPRQPEPRNPRGGTALATARWRRKKAIPGLSRKGRNEVAKIFRRWIADL